MTRVCQICPKTAEYSKSLSQKLLLSKSSPYAGGKGTVFPFMRYSHGKRIAAGKENVCWKGYFFVL